MVRKQKTELEGKPESRAFTGASSGKAARQSRVKSLGLTRLNNSNWLWAKGMISSCLVPGPGVI